MANLYWNGEGKHKLLAKKLCGFIPAQGESDNEIVEMYRVIRNAYYDFHNNGGCNRIRVKALCTTMKGKYKRGSGASKIITKLRQYGNADGGYLPTHITDEMYETLVDEFIETYMVELKEVINNG